MSCSRRTNDQPVCEGKLVGTPRPRVGLDDLTASRWQELHTQSWFAAFPLYPAVDDDNVGEHDSCCWVKGLHVSNSEAARAAPSHSSSLCPIAVSLNSCIMHHTRDSDQNSSLSTSMACTVVLVVVASISSSARHARQGS